MFCQICKSKAHKEAIAITYDKQNPDKSTGHKSLMALNESQRKQL